ncbi:MAG: 23S rRNA (uracil(1939)-C(5))-methyltransferase RlmD [Clostridia bacterium]|nr:23S rRNA (uracil(1939)-C(5))-methyltransferase RlmD [Clostridia bacterium]
MLKKNDEVTLTIDAMTAEGSGIGRYDGMAVFVPNTAVGDSVLCHIIKAKKNYAVGKAFKVFTASHDRVEPDCPVAGKCGGCCYRHIAYEAELSYKRQRVIDAFERIGHLDVEVLPVLGSEETLRYRNKAQFPVALDKNQNPTFGFYAPNTHRVVPCDDCLLKPELFGDVLTVVREWVIRRGITVYDETTHRGLLRHVYIRKGHYSGQVMVCLVVNGDPSVSVPRTSFLADALRDTIPGFRTLSVNYNPAKTNVILGKETEVLYGDGFIEDELLGCTFRLSPRSFYQVNTPQAEVLYRLAADRAGLTGNEVLLDLYCGTGTIGLTMADRCSRLYGVEIVPEAVEDAQRNAAANGTTNATFFCGDAAGAAARLKADGVRADVILVDPPRKGLSEALVQTIADLDPKRVVYISCDPATLARDCARFADQGWHIAGPVQPVDLFPRTSHVETVVTLTKE